MALPASSPPLETIAMLAAGDDYADDSSTTGTVSVGQTVSGSIETDNDKDWFAIELIAGQPVKITLDDAFLPIPRLALYDSNGNLFEIDIGAGEPASASFIAPESGVYYIEARSLLSSVTGNYELSVQEVSTAQASPLVETITWGTQLSDNTITVYFAPAGYDATSAGFGTIDAEGFNNYELGQFQHAFDAIEAVINVNFITTNDPGQADLILVLDTDDIGPGGYLGVFNPPGTSGAGTGVFNGALWDRTPGGDLEVGGFGYVTIVHELLHGLGLAHPHDTGGSSTVMQGVTSAYDDYGDFNLNQGVYTTMSYNSGFPNGPAGTVPPGQVGTDYGFEAGPMAIDIAALQVIYGANPTHASGNNVYTLPTGNSEGTYWQTIWDTGGTDEIRHSGSTAAVIDLREATLQQEDGGGGFISAVNATAGGFTIANGVVIENATGGSGADKILGNTAANQLSGGDGFDTIYGGLGDDTIDGGDKADRLYGGGGNDSLDGGAGTDILYGEAGNDTLRSGSEADRLYGGTGDDLMFGGWAFGTTVDGLWGEEGNDTLYGELGYDLLDGGDGNDLLDGGGQADNLYGQAGNDTLRGGQGFDRLFGGDGDDFLRGGSESDGLFGGAGNDTLAGESGNDRFFGEVGNDLLDGGTGNDTLGGGAGFDTLKGGEGDDLLLGNFNADRFVFADGHGDDTIGDFAADNGLEKIDLRTISAITDLADLAANHMTQVGANVLIDTGGGNSITLTGVTLSDLDSTDFLF